MNIKLPEGMRVKKDKPSIPYAIIIGVAIYHLIIFIGFALASFITMENHFKSISFFDWHEMGRLLYVVCYFPTLVISTVTHLKDTED